MAAPIEAVCYSLAIMRSMTANLGRNPRWMLATTLRVTSALIGMLMVMFIGIELTR